jgi:hypothetical protein
MSTAKSGSFGSGLIFTPQRATGPRFSTNNARIATPSLAGLVTILPTGDIIYFNVS